MDRHWEAGSTRETAGGIGRRKKRKVSMNNDNIVSEVPEGEFLRDSRDGLFLTGQLLADYRACPYCYRLKTTGRLAEPESKTRRLECAAHCLILCGDAAFGARYIASDGPVNPRTETPFGRSSRVFAEWAESQDREVIPVHDFRLASEMRESVSRHRESSRLLSEGRPGGVVRTDYAGVPCQVKLDWFSEWNGIVELEICENLDFFARDFHRRRLGHLYAFYRSVLQEAGGRKLPVHVVAVERRVPHRCGVWLVSAEMLDARAVENERAIGDLMRSYEDDTWPTGYEATLVMGEEDAR